MNALIRVPVGPPELREAALRLLVDALQSVPVDMEVSIGIEAERPDVELVPAADWYREMRHRMKSWPMTLGSV